MDFYVGSKESKIKLFVDFWMYIPPHFYCFWPCFTHPSRFLHTLHCGFHVNIPDIYVCSYFLPTPDDSFSWFSIYPQPDFLNSFLLPSSLLSDVYSKYPIFLSHRLLLREVFLFIFYVFQSSTREINRIVKLLFSSEWLTFPKDFLPHIALLSLQLNPIAPPQKTLARIKFLPGLYKVDRKPYHTCQALK